MLLIHFGIVTLQKKNVHFLSLVYVCVCVRQHLNKTLHVPKGIFILSLDPIQSLDKIFS